MVNTFGNNIVSAFTNGVSVKEIYANGVKVWPSETPPVPPTSEYYIRWAPSDLSSGRFRIGSSTYNFSDYSGYFTDFDGVIFLLRNFYLPLVKVYNMNLGRVDGQPLKMHVYLCPRIGRHG